MRRHCLIALAGLLLAGGASAGERVLDKRSYWHCFYTFGPVLSDDGKIVAHSYASYGGKWTMPAARAIKSLPPSVGWVKPELDDSSWVRLRGGIEPGRAHTFRQMYLRARFEVPDPARVKGLRLEVVVRGGAVAYVNGREVGRVGVPAGPVGPKTYAELYPEEAYGWKRDGKLKWVPDFRYGEPYPKDGRGFVYGGYVEISARSPGTCIRTLSKEEWKRINSLRNRKVGSVEVPRKLLRKGMHVVAVVVCGNLKTSGRPH